MVVHLIDPRLGYEGMLFGCDGRRGVDDGVLW